MPKLAHSLPFLALATLMAACQTRQPVARDDYHPRFEAVNVTSTPVIPAHIQRVVVLPMWADRLAAEEFSLELSRLFQSELGRRNAFEVISVSRENLTTLFSKPQMASVDNLPDDFLIRLQQAYAADAVLMTDLTVYQPYKPISVGVRAKLVDLRRGQIFWSIDSVFDSADPAVAQAARDFAGRATYNPYPVDSSNVILQSPRRFADFVAYSVFRTLPPRA